MIYGIITLTTPIYDNIFMDSTLVPLRGWCCRIKALGGCVVLGATRRVFGFPAQPR